MGNEVLIETYLHDYADVDFSRGICPDCARELYPDDFADDPGSEK